MEVSSKGVALIKEFESFRAAPYLCAAGVPTIGWGSTRYPDGRAVKLSDPKITKAVGDMYLHHDLSIFERAVNRALIVPVSQCQFDACVSLCYNVGQGNFAASTLVKMVNAGNTPEAVAPQFLRWDKAKGRSLAGLTRRRTTEMALFLTSTA